MDWNNKRIRLYIEAGLAVLLVLTLALAGASGRLSASADDSGRQAEAVSGQENSGQAEQGASQAEAEAGNAGTAEVRRSRAPARRKRGTQGQRRKRSRRGSIRSWARVR